jgi:outer membrane protein assembly factor BamE (lipoprotein component of BamABCDE complex)
MQATMKRTMVLVILALALLLSLAAWTAHAMTTPAAPYHTGVHSGQSIAWYCPPPPRDC